MNANTALAIAMTQAGITTETETRERLAALSLTADTGDANHDRRVSYILNGLSFVGEKFASDYARAKLAARNPKAGTPAPTEQDIEAVREKARLFNSYVGITGMDIDPQNVADFLCGIRGSVEPKEKEIIDAAEANQCTMQQAADIVRTRKLKMLSSAQVRNMKNHGLIQDWLRDTERFGMAKDDTPVLEALQNQLVQSYKKAAEWGDQESRYIIESYAKQFDTPLPSWQSCLPVWTEAHSKQLIDVQRRQNEIADARAQAEAEAERQLSEQFGDF